MVIELDFAIIVKSYTAEYDKILSAVVLKWVFENRFRMCKLGTISVTAHQWKYII